MWKPLFVSIFFVLSSSYSNETANRVKTELQTELKNDFLKILEQKFGQCGSSTQSCLSLKDNYLLVNLPKQEICFPYTTCGFYHCMEQKYHCSDVGVDYFTKLAFPTCQAYEKNISNNQFSDQGVDWIYRVMVCLQKGLINECIIAGHCPTGPSQEQQKLTCDHITEFTLNYHPGCYIESGVGVCHLPLKDKIEIWKTVNPFMTKRERDEAYKVIFNCFRPKGL